jgi:hypothetical protein
MYVEGKNWIIDEESRNKDWREINKPEALEYNEVSYVTNPDRIVVKMVDEDTGNIIY